MFERVETRQELFTHKVGAALKMENTVLEMLGKLEETAQRRELQEQFRHHAEETRDQIRNLEAVFAALGLEPDEKACPAIEGLEKEAQANIKMTDDRLLDAVVLAGAAETEHHEIAVYENLITQAETMDEQDIVALLQENLEQEQHTLQEVKQASLKLSRELAGQSV
jgi:ferritin-like metal-binding protein YciE